MTTPERPRRRRTDAIRTEPQINFLAPDAAWIDRVRDKIRAAQHVPAEGASEHLRTAMTILRHSLDVDEPVVDDGVPAIVVPLSTLARIQVRLECALEQIEGVCLKCGGTVLVPTIGGTARGSCHCPR